MNEEQWVFTADKITVQKFGETEGTDSYRLHPSKKPKEIDRRSGRSDVVPGVYSLEGDVLKLCAPMTSKDGTRGPRPTEVAVGEGGKNIVLTFKRVAADKDKPKEDKPKDDAKVKKLLQDMVQAAKEEYKLREQAYLNLTASPEPLAGAARRILTAELEQSEKKEDRVKACEEYLQRTTDVAKRAMNVYKTGQATQADALQAEYYRLEAEIMLEREKAK
jgi:uncharacterized protein (TIGR03067 family)